jgi:death-on-curing protein
VSEPSFLTVATVEAIHELQIRRYGGTSGLRDRDGLEAAVFQPENVFFYAAGDLYEIAAAYAFHIAQARAFLDGNKRTAMGAALAFLETNGVSTATATELLEDAMIGIAEKRVDRSALAALFRQLFPQ